jgi:protein TonB
MWSQQALTRENHPVPATADNVVAFARPASVPRQTASPPVTASAPMAPAYQAHRRAGLLALAAVSAGVHVGLLFVLNREPPPLPGVMLEAISVEIVADGGPADSAATPPQPAEAAAPPETPPPEAAQLPPQQETAEPPPPAETASKTDTDPIAQDPAPSAATPEDSTQPTQQAEAPAAEAEPPPAADEPPSEPTAVPAPALEAPPVPSPAPAKMDAAEQQPAPRPPPPPKPREERRAEPTRPPRAIRPAEQSAPRPSRAAPRTASLSPSADSRGGAARSAASNYPGLVAAHLARNKQYPAEARSRGDRGTATVSFRIDGGGRVVSVALARGTGSPSLDAETVAMVRRASPFPPPPDGRAASFTVPVTFRVQ